MINKAVFQALRYIISDFHHNTLKKIATHLHRSQYHKPLLLVQYGSQVDLKLSVTENQHI